MDKDDDEYEEAMLREEPAQYYSWELLQSCEAFSPVNIGEEKERLKKAKEEVKDDDQPYEEDSLREEAGEEETISAFCKCVNRPSTFVLGENGYRVVCCDCLKPARGFCYDC